jgi:hypothetical protein
MGSRRSDIFRMIVPHINCGRFFEWEGHIVFGSMSAPEFFERVTSRPDQEGSQRIEEVLVDFIDEMVVDQGREQISRRLSIGDLPKRRMESLKGLSPEELLRLQAMIEGYRPEYEAFVEQSGGSSGPASYEDSIDASLTTEILGQLPKAVDRVLALGEMELGKVSREEVRGYFEEAHHCYLYGFNVACAVLCRALLESALEDVCDPMHQIEEQVNRRGIRGESYFQTLVSKANSDGLLTDDRPRCAKDVRNAGNDAIHNLTKFNHKWLARMGEILDNTRKILIDLYAEV